VGCNFDAQQLLRCRRRRLEFDRALSLCPAVGGKSASLSLSNDVSYSVTLLDLGIRLRSGELAMRVDRGIDLRTVVGVVALILCSFTTPNAARAEDKTYVMKLGTATINESQHEWCKRFVAMVEKDSGGRIKGEIYPASQLGAIPRQLEGVQFGAIQGYVGPPEFLAGIDERYEVLSAPGLVADLAHEVRIVKDPELQKLMLGFGADKGIHGAALFIAQPSLVIARAPIAHLADFTGKKLRVFAADMQQEMIKSLGSSPVAMTLGDVLPAIQQGAIDGSVLAMTVITTMHFWDAAKYVTEIDQPFIFSMAFLSKKWFDALPADLQTIVDADAAKAAIEVNPWQVEFFNKARQTWAEHGELIRLPENEQSQLIKSVTAVGAAVAKRKPSLEQAYDVFAAAAKRTK
jgi:TRAP-type C4-dicarboxylate transport system substrate-binding protein